jgi:hypothetical protein
MEGPTDKKQPWRDLYPLLGLKFSKNGAVIIPEQSGKPVKNTQNSRFIAKSWYELERGRLAAAQEEEMSKIFKREFDDKPWYDVKTGFTNRKPCPSCGNDSCTCSVFEGG